MILKESKEGYMGECYGRKEEGKEIIIISKVTLENLKNAKY